jgi:IS1 family transposase
MVTKVITCPHCGSDDVVKNGFAPNNGKQKYLCHACGRQSREDPSPNGYTEERKEEILRAYQERSSLRGLRRTFGVSPTTQSSAGSKKVADLELKDTLLFSEPSDENKVLELDELWSFVYRKSEKVWVWLALCRESRQIVAFVMGDRSRATCERLWQEIPESYKGSTCYSDFWEAYREVLPEEQHEATSKEEGETCHVERWINTLRQRLSRFVRKTLSFSKSAQMHHCCLKLFIHRYNLERRCIILE